MEDCAIGLAHHVGEHVQSAAMWHAVNDFAHAQRAAIFDDAFQRGDHRLAAVQTESFGTDIFAAQKLFILLGFDHFAQDRLFAFGRKFNRGVLALHPFLQEPAFLKVGYVHIFKADGAAIIGAQYFD